MKNIFIENKSLLKSDSKDKCENSYKEILSYFLPEFITCFILYFIINILDSFFISKISSFCFANSGVIETLFHFITKTAEGFSVGLIILCGMFNGNSEYKKAGEIFSNSFWIFFIFGSIISIVLYTNAYSIYSLYQLPKDICNIGVPYLRLRAISVFFSFIFFSLIGFLRAIKNTKVPMIIFIIGSLIFIFFDYVLIFGKLGFTQYGFNGSAIACIIHYVSMLIITLIYILFDPNIKKYCINWRPKFNNLNINYINDFINLSLPVIIDKATFAIFYIWLSNRTSFISASYDTQTCTTLLSSFNTIKHIERLSILPAIALTQVITFLVSNSIKNNDKTNKLIILAHIKKVLIISFFMVSSILIFFMLWPKIFISLFDQEGSFTINTANIIPIISILVLFDMVQLILAAALRGAAQVKTVMWTRLIIGGLFFIPTSYILSIISIKNLNIKFMLIYSTFYISNVFMSIVYMKILKNNYNN